MAGFGRILWRWTAGVFAVLAIALAVLFGVFRIAVSHAPEYRQPIEARVSAAIGLPVTIGRLDARLGLGGPEILLADVVVLDEAGASPLLEADAATVSLDVTELLLRWRIGWDQVTLDGVLLDVVREQDGVFLVLGRRLDELPRDPGRPLPRGEFRLENSRLYFEDRAASSADGGPVTWLFDDVRLSVSSGGDGLRITGDFLPPPAAGERVVFWANRLEPAGDWRAYLGSQAIQFGALARVRELAGRVPAAGQATLRVWLDGQGVTPTAADVEFDLKDVWLPTEAAGSAAAAPSVTYERLGGRLEWTREPDGWQAVMEGLEVRRRGSSWRAQRLSASSRLEPGGGRRELELAADYLRLDDLRPLVPRLPEGVLRTRLEEMAPQGEIRALDVEIVAAGGTPEDAGYRVTAQAELQEVSVRPSGTAPGIDGLSGRVRSDPRGGRFEFGGDSVRLDYPSLFREPLAFTRAEGLLLWNAGADGLILIGDGLELATADVTLEAGLRLRLADEDQPGSIDLRGELTGLDVPRAGPYLPVGIMKPNLVRWLDNALVAGRVPRAQVRIEGPLRGFPYREDQGLFRVAFTAEALDLDYAAGWPVASGLTADIVFENEGMSAVIRDGELSGLDVDTVRATFDDLLTGELVIDGGLSGPLTGVHRYLLDSPPIRAALGNAVADLKIEGGGAQVQADIFLPIKDLARRRVAVDVAVERGMVGYAGVVFALTDVAGDLRIRDDDVFSDNLTARLLKQPVEIDVSPNADLGVRADIVIQTTGAALIEALGLPFGDHVAGATEVRGMLQFPSPGSGRRFWTRFESDLEGLALTLPAPFDKSASERVNYSHEIRFPESGGQSWYMRLGDEMSARALVSTDGGRLRFVRATVEGGTLEPTLNDGDGLFVKGAFDAVSIDDWLALDLGGEPSPDGATRFEEFFAGADVRVQDLRAMNQQVADAGVRMVRGADSWTIEIDSEAVAGTVTLPFELAGRERAVVLDMTRLSLFDDPRDGSDKPGDPAVVPPLEITVGDFRAYGIRLGRLETRLNALPAGFDVPSFTATGPSFTINGSLRSELGPGVDSSSLKVDVKSTDVASTLEYAGFAPTLAASKLEFGTDLGWRGGLVPGVLSVAEGSARLDVGSGRLVDVKPGAGRVFGLLSVQALPRRLMLDFRDVFEKGFFFDKLTGDFQIAGGQARTDNLAMKGRAADIGIIGSVDLVQRSYDQTAVVSAQIGNTLPVVGAIAAGPIIGGGLFILKEILKEPLKEAGQVQYRITGPWDDPVVAKVTGESGGAQATRGNPAPGEG